MDQNHEGGSSLSRCKLKRKRVERVFKLKAFGEKGYPIEGTGSFRENIGALLEHGNLETVLLENGMAVWSFQLEVRRHPLSHVLLFVIEESIEQSPQRHCKYCVYVGWGEQMICNKKYHFVVPSKDTVAGCLSYQGNVADIAMGKLDNLVELNGHIMHGVFHSNGFGHLLCLNGFETGSDLPGHHIMDFWDRLSTVLQARKVSLKDIAHKGSMDLRLVYGVAYNETWFGRWGYKFVRGSFGVTQQIYDKAMEALQKIPLSLIAHQLGAFHLELPIIFLRYQTLSGNSLLTLGDLLRFVLHLKARLPKESAINSYNPGILVEDSCRWSPKRIEMAARVIVESLKKAKFKWVSRQEVRDAARAYVGDTGLLDFVLKSLGNHMVGKYLVRRCLNPITKVLEYCLEDISDALPYNQEGFIAEDSKLSTTRRRINRIQVANDIFYLYKSILKGPTQVRNGGLVSAMSIASRVILDSKYFVKEYNRQTPSTNAETQLRGKPRIYCTIALGNKGDAKNLVAPYEAITLGDNATFDELIGHVVKSFKETYWGLKNFAFESITNCSGADGSDLVLKYVKIGSKLTFEGNLGDMGGMTIKDICESGWRNCVIDCSCGTKDDDGERMVACDICEVWRHTRCVQIPNNEEIPSIFLCNRCEQDLLVVPSLPLLESNIHIHQ